MNEVIIEASGLTKSFPGRVVAVKDLDLEVKRGMVYGLIGRNASGKTTTLRLLLGLLQPDCGEARILGWNFWRAPRAVRSRVGYVCQSQSLPEAMTLEQLCWYLGRCYERWDSGYARQMAERWNLPWRSPLGHLSNGRQRQAAILLAFAARPEVVVLDEPAAGLDPVARREVLEEMIEALGQNDGCTVLLSTHLISDLERVADHIGILDRGRMALSLSLESLLQQFKRVQVIFRGEATPADFVVPGALSPVRRSGPVLQTIVRWTHDHELDALRGAVDARVQVFPMGLEEIFIELFGSHTSGAVSVISQVPMNAS